MTKKERLVQLLGNIQELVPAPQGLKYVIDYNATYGGYQLLLESETGTTCGCFGGSGMERRVNYDVMLLKIQAIIATAKECQKIFL